MYFPLDPEDFPEKTHKYEGREATPQEKSMGVTEEKKELPVYVDNIRAISCWKTKSLKARFWFLLTGKIWVEVQGSHPAIGLGIGKMFSVKHK